MASDPGLDLDLSPEWRDMRLTLIMSLFCNIRCNFCFQDSFEESVCLSDEVLFQKLSPVYARTSSILLQGGEVTALPNGLSLLRYLGTNYPDIALRLTTNGVTMSDAWLSELIRNEVSLGISLNASKPEVFQAILVRGSAQTVWTKIYDNLFKLVKAKRELGSSSYVEVSMVITEDTVADVEDFVRLACALGVAARLSYDCRSGVFSPAIERSFKTVLYLQRACVGIITVGAVNAPPAGREFAAAFWADEKDQEEYAAYEAAFRRSLREFQFPRGHSMAPDASPDISALLPPSRTTLSKSAVAQTRSVGTGPRFTTVAGRRVCAEPWHSMVFMAQGSVLFCCQTPNYPLGNVKDTVPIEEIWNGPKAREFRRLMLKGDYRYCDPNCPANLGVISSVVRAAEFFARGDYVKALEIFRACGEIPVDDGGALYQWAYAEHVAGDAQRGVELYGRALQAGFAEFWVRYHRAQALDKLGARAEALADMERACGLDPSHQGARELLGAWASVGSVANAV